MHLKKDFFFDVYFKSIIKSIKTLKNIKLSIDTKHYYDT